VSTKTTQPAIKPITVLLRQIQGATRRATEEALWGNGLTAAQANVLTELAYGRPRSNAELARLHSVTPQSMVEILATLERRGLISRSAKPKRGRAMPAELTKEGRSQLLSVHLAMRQVEERILSSLSTAEISQLRKLLEASLVGIETDHPGNGSGE
jgi:DNA-binding MarR family transcriptional regulator